MERIMDNLQAADRIGMLYKLFGRADTNKDGTLDKNEIKAFDEENQKFLEKIDNNYIFKGDSKTSIIELINGMRSKIHIDEKGDIGKLLEVENLFEIVRNGNAKQKLEAKNQLMRIDVDDSHDGFAASVVFAYERAAQDSNKDVRAVATECVSTWFYPQSNTLSRERWAATILSSTQSPSDQVISVLISLSKNNDWEIRRSAVRGLGSSSNNDEAKKSLVLALEDDTDFVRFAAAKSLGKVDPNLAITEFGKLLKSSTKDIRITAAQGLSQLKDERAEKLLLDALIDGDKGATRQISAVRDIQKLIIDILSDNESKTLMVLLLNYLPKSNSKIRPLIVKILDRMEGNLRHSTHYKEYSYDEREKMRTPILQALKQFDSSKAK